MKTFLKVIGQFIVGIFKAKKREDEYLYENFKVKEKIDKLTYKILIKKLDAKEPFTFSRFGDGEFNTIFNKKDTRGNMGKNCDGHLYYPELGIELLDILKSQPKYFMGLQPLAMRIEGEEIQKLFQENNINIEWSDTDILHNASICGDLGLFIKALKNNECNILAAPEFLSECSKLFPIHERIIVPDTNAWLEIKQITYDIIKAINLNHKKKKNIIVLIMAGMTANVILDTLYIPYGERITIIDTGSVFDPYCGRNSRSYHKKLEIKAI